MNIKWEPFVRSRKAQISLNEKKSRARSFLVSNLPHWKWQLNLITQRIGKEVSGKADNGFWEHN